MAVEMTDRGQIRLAAVYLPVSVLSSSSWLATIQAIFHSIAFIYSR